MEESKQHQQSKRPHPLSHFFGCCLGDKPTPISPKIQHLREKKGQIKQIKINSDLQITSDMIVADLIFNFPQIKSYLSEIHPLGLLSPNLNSTTLELFLADLPSQNTDQTCQKLTQLISRQK